MPDTDAKINFFAILSFRDVADGDYIAARMAYKGKLYQQFLWASLQAVEKYLKCILLLNRIEAKKIFHDLTDATKRINGSGVLTLNVSPLTTDFIRYLDSYGRFRYFETPFYTEGSNLFSLDRTVWELRQYCKTSTHAKKAAGNADSKEALTREIELKAIEKRIKDSWTLSPQKSSIAGGFLEGVVDDVRHPARGALLWQNPFFGKRTRKSVSVRDGLYSANSPLSLYPEILDEVLKYVFLPKDVIEAYKRA